MFVKTYFQKPSLSLYSLYYAEACNELAVFQVLILKFDACSMKQTFYPLHKLYEGNAWAWQHESYFYRSFLLPDCQTCMCKRSIRFTWFGILKNESVVVWLTVVCRVLYGLCYIISLWRPTVPHHEPISVLLF